MGCMNFEPAVWFLFGIGFLIIVGATHLIMRRKRKPKFFFKYLISFYILGISVIALSKYLELLTFGTFHWGSCGGIYTNFIKDLNMTSITTGSHPLKVLSSNIILVPALIYTFISTFIIKKIKK